MDFLANTIVIAYSDTFYVFNLDKNYISKFLYCTYKDLFWLTICINYLLLLLNGFNCAKI